MSEKQEYQRISKAIGAYIKALRINSNLTQEALAAKAHLTRVTISDIENGTAAPTLKGLTAIAMALGISVGDLFSSGVVHQSTYIVQPTGGNLYQVFKNQLTSVQNGKLDIQVAYAKSSGVDLLTAPLNAFRNAGGYLQATVGIDQKNTSAEALFKLMNLCDSLYVVHDRAFAQTYHPKVYIVSTAKQAWVAVGSNNLTRGGLCTNYEICHTQTLNLENALDLQAYQSLTETINDYRAFGILKKISTEEDIKALLSNGLIVTEQQSRQYSARHGDWKRDTEFGHYTVSAIPPTADRIPVPLGLFAPSASPAAGKKSAEASKAQALWTVLDESDVTAASFLDLELSPEVQDVYWFEMRASTGGSRNILDLSSTAKLRAGSHPQTIDGTIPGSVTFFGLDPLLHEVEKNVSIVYNGITYYPSTIKYAPNNASWRIQLKGDAETGNGSLSQFGRTNFVNHILVFHRITLDSYILETMPGSELATLKQNSEFWATNGSSSASKAFGKIKTKA